MKPIEQTDGTGDYKFDTPNRLLSAIKVEESSDSESTDFEYKLFTEDLAVTTALYDEPLLKSAFNQEIDDIKSISTEMRFIHKEDGFVIKEEPEINELLIKDELDISPAVLRPRTPPHSQPSAKEHDFVVKEENEINELVIKDELDISPVVLQPRTPPHSQPSAEARAPGTSVHGDVTPAPSDAYDSTDHIPVRRWQIQSTYAKKGISKLSKPVGDTTAYR